MTMSTPADIERLRSDAARLIDVGYDHLVVTGNNGDEKAAHWSPRGDGCYVGEAEIMERIDRGDVMRLGIHAAANGILILDCDPKDCAPSDNKTGEAGLETDDWLKAEEWLMKHVDPLIDAGGAIEVNSRDPNGFHIYFAHPGGDVPSFIRPGIGVRARGYAVAWDIPRITAKRKSELRCPSPGTLVQVAGKLGRGTGGSGLVKFPDAIDGLRKNLKGQRREFILSISWEVLIRDPSASLEDAARAVSKIVVDNLPRPSNSAPEADHERYRQLTSPEPGGGNEIVKALRFFYEPRTEYQHRNRRIILNSHAERSGYGLGEPVFKEVAGPRKIPLAEWVRDKDGYAVAKEFDLWDDFYKISSMARGRREYNERRLREAGAMDPKHPDHRLLLLYERM